MRRIALIAVLLLPGALTAQETTAKKLAKLRAESQIQLDQLADLVEVIAEELDKTKAETRKATEIALAAQKDANAALSQNTAFQGKLGNLEQAMTALTSELKAQREAGQNRVVQVGVDWANEPIWRTVSGTSNDASGGWGVSDNYMTGRRRRLLQIFMPRFVSPIMGRRMGGGGGGRAST